MPQKSEQKVKIGLVARCDNGGLGILTQDFFRNFYIAKTLTVTSHYENDYDRFKGYEGSEQIICQRGAPTLEEIDQFLEGLDLVIAFETPYNWNLFSRARQKGVKTALVVMYEWTPPKDTIPAEPDLYICPSELDYEKLWEPKVHLPVPINRFLFPFKERTEAKNFIFNNGHGGWNGRNSLQEFLQAVPLVKSDVKFNVRSQVQFDTDENPKISVQLGELPQGELWKTGDIYVHLHKFDGLSLPLNEAMSSGYPIIALDIAPANKFLPKELLVPIETTIRVFNNIAWFDSCIVSPLKIAEKIDYVASLPPEKIKEISHLMDKKAEEWSWPTLKPKYLEVFHKLCNKTE